MAAAEKAAVEKAAAEKAAAEKAAASGNTAVPMKSVRDNPFLRRDSQQPQTISRSAVAARAFAAEKEA